MPKINPLPDRQFLLELFDYDMDSGELLYRRKPARKLRAGSPAGTLHHSGYVQVCVDRVLYLGHRLIWKMQTGVNPVEIDHRNGVRSDNRWSNLREATSSQNKFNRVVVNHHRGVHFIARDRKFGAQIRAHGEHRWLGSYLLPEDACRAYRVAAAELHGEFTKEGRCGCR